LPADLELFIAILYLYPMFKSLEEPEEFVTMWDGDPVKISTKDYTSFLLEFSNGQKYVVGRDPDDEKNQDWYILPEGEPGMIEFFQTVIKENFL
jgi:hypothetical protein